MQFTATSVPSDDAKPNEDWYVAADDVQIVLDGATVRTDTGCRHGLPWFVRRLGTQLFVAAQDRDTSLPQAIAAGIEAVAGEHRDTCDLTHPGTPSAAVGITRSTGQVLEWACLGDITIAVDTGAGGVQVCSDDRVSRTALPQRRECDRHPLGTDAKLAAIQAMKPHELAARNTDGGYWIASVVPQAAEHAVTGSALLTQVSRYAVCSDGVLRGREFGLLDEPGAVVAALIEHGPHGLVQQVRNAERADPDGARVPRNKHTDDATALLAVR